MESKPTITHCMTSNIREIPSVLLRQAFAEKQAQKPWYSMRAFAKKLGVSPAYVSLVFQGKKKVSLQRAMQMASILGMKSRESQDLIDHVALRAAINKNSQPFILQAIETKKRKEALPFVNYKMLATDQLRVLHQWYHLPILDLTTCENFKPNVHWISKRLKISTIAVRDAVDRLQRLGLLEIQGKKWKKTTDKIYFPTQKSEVAVRQYHTQMLDKAKEALNNTHPSDFAKRSVTALTLTVNPEHLEKAKKIIAQCQAELAELLTQGPNTEVYQLNVQLFPLTQEIS